MSSLPFLKTRVLQRSQIVDPTYYITHQNDKKKLTDRFKEFLIHLILKNDVKCLPFILFMNATTVYSKCLKCFSFL